MSNYRNHLLSQLPQSEIAMLQPHIETVSLPLRAVLIQPGAVIEHVFFLESGLGSEVAVEGDINQIEVGVIGREGLIGLPIILGRKASPHKTFMQVGGEALRIPAAVLAPAIETSSALRTCLLRYTHDFVLQLAETARANGRFKIQARLARWILMCQDRIDGDMIPLTHEFLGLMLGVRRAGVTEALAALEGQGVVRSAKSNILVTDRDGLETIACSIYGRAIAFTNEGNRGFTDGL
jgi:CRP-like cAMP-binding protein